MFIIIVVFSAIALTMAIITAVGSANRKTAAWLVLLAVAGICATIFVDTRFGVIAERFGSNINYFYVAIVVCLFIIFMLIAYIMRANDKTHESLLAVLAGIVLAMMVLCFGGDFLKQPEQPAEEVIEYASDIERYVSELTEEELFREWGYPRRFRDASLNYRREERVKKTKLKDAVTYFDDDDSETNMTEEILSNPVYLQSLNYILQDCGIIGKSAWVKDFSQGDYSQWVAIDGYVTSEYHIIACRFLTICNRCADYVETSKNWQPTIHYGLDGYYEAVKKVPSESKVGASWRVYQFVGKTTRYYSKTEDDNTFIGFYTNDGRWAILEKAPKKSAPKTDVGASAAPKADVDASAISKMDIAASVPSIPFDWNALPYHHYTQPQANVIYAPGEVGLRVNQIPDNKGNAPVGGFGSGTDNLSAGTLQSKEPTHVLADKDQNNNTIIYQPKTGNSSRVSSSSSKTDHVDERKVDNKPVTKTNTTTYKTTGTTSSKNTGNTAIDDVNNGTVNGF